MNAYWRQTNPQAITIAENRDRRIITDPPVESGKMTSLFVWTQTEFLKVAASGIDVMRLIQMKGPANGERTLVCGERGGASFVRDDGLMCHFKIAVRETAKHLALISYVLHADTPSATAGSSISPAFLRWEFALSRKTGVDAIVEPLSHIHPGHDRVRIPVPVLTPKELLTGFLGLERWW